MTQFFHRDNLPGVVSECCHATILREGWEMEWSTPTNQGVDTLGIGSDEGRSDVLQAGHADHSVRTCKGCGRRDPVAVPNLWEAILALPRDSFGPLYRDEPGSPWYAEEVRQLSGLTHTLARLDGQQWSVLWQDGQVIVSADLPEGLDPWDERTRSKLPR